MLSNANPARLLVPPSRISPPPLHVVSIDKAPFKAQMFESPKAKLKQRTHATKRRTDGRGTPTKQNALD